MKKRKKVYEVLITIGEYSLIAGLGVGTSIGIIKVVNAIRNKNYKEEYKDVYDYYLHTSTGAPLKLPIYNNNISVIFNGFSDEAKENARHAISKIDDVLKTQSFTIYDNDKPNHNNYIKVDIVNNVTTASDNNYHSAVAQTTLNYNDNNGTIIYPIHIEIEQSFVNKYDNSWYGTGKSPEKSQFSSILQHEIGHALGLKDIYSNDMYEKSVMFWTINGNTQNYTDLDTHNLRYIYDRGNDVYEVSVTTPDAMQLLSYYPQNKIEEDDELSM